MKTSTEGTVEAEETTLAAAWPLMPLAEATEEAHKNLAVAGRETSKGKASNANWKVYDVCPKHTSLDIDAANSNSSVTIR
jgi:hypothetical protein